MTNRTIVIRRNSCWQRNIKRKTLPQVVQKSHSRTAGFINPVFIVLAAAAFAGLFYIYSVNQTAIKGIAIQNAEKEIAARQKENESLKIKEAELNSLYHIEQASKDLNMIDANNVKYLEESPTVAFKN